MAFIPAPATVKCELNYTASGQRVQNTLWVYDISDSWSATKMSLLAAQLILWWETELAPLTSNGVVLEEVAVTDWSADTAPSIAVTAIDAVGDLTSPIMPLNVTVTTTFKTAGRGRSSRGRNYFVGLTEGQCLGNQVTATVVDDIRAAYSALSTYLETADPDLRHVVVSFISDGEERTSGLAQEVTSYANADNNVDSQRRRLTGRGL